MAPGTLELLAHERGLVGPLLGGERNHQPKEGASVAAVPLEIGAENALGVSAPPRDSRTGRYQAGGSSYATPSSISTARPSCSISAFASPRAPAMRARST